MQKFEIPGRTKLYNLSGWSPRVWKEAEDLGLDYDEYSELRKKEFEKSCKIILDYSTIEDWIEEFLYDIPLRAIQATLYHEFGIRNITINAEYRDN